MLFKKVLFLCLIFTVSMSAFAQDKITLKEEQMSDIYPQSLWKSSGKGYLFKVGDGDFQGVGHKGNRLEEVLKNDEEAYKEFKKFKRKVAIAKVGFYVGMGSLLAYPLAIDQNDTDEEFARKTLTICGISLTGSITSIVLNFSAPKHLHNAVEIYNRNLNK